MSWLTLARFTRDLAQITRRWWVVYCQVRDQAYRDYGVKPARPLASEPPRTGYGRPLGNLRVVAVERIKPPRRVYVPGNGDRYCQVWIVIDAGATGYEPGAVLHSVKVWLN